MPRLTEFGKRCRQLRLELEILLKEMADALGVSSAHLSAVELGKKPPSEDLTAKAIAFFAAYGIDASDLIGAATKTRKEVRINLQNAPEPRRELAVAFARRFPGLTDQEVKDVLNSLTQGRKHEHEGGGGAGRAHVPRGRHGSGD